MLKAENWQMVSNPWRCHHFYVCLVCHLTVCLPAQQLYTWRIDLTATEPHWQGWFRGLSPLFLDAPAPKVLLLAGIDRLDRELAVGQMQGQSGIDVGSRDRFRVSWDRYRVWQR